MKKFLLAVMLVAMMCVLGGCVKPYDTPEFVTIEASQTAFLIPLVGDTSDQASFESEELLAQAKVATKEIQIPHRWVQTGRWSWYGEWRASAKLIIVERKPVTREWASDAQTATSNATKAILAESIESVGFYVGMNCSAQINEEDATKFLYRYNNKALEDIIDTDIRSMVEKEFNDECGKYTIEEIRQKKTEIMDKVVEAVSSHFKDYGITITVLGMKEGISYENAAIQEAIDEKFSSEQMIVTQQNLNEVAVAKAQAEAEAALLKAQADAEAVKIAAEAEAEANKKLAASLTPELIEMMKYERWNGQLPTITGSDTLIVDVTGD